MVEHIVDRERGKRLETDSDKLGYKSILTYQTTDGFNKKAGLAQELITLDSIDAKVNSISPQELFWWYAKSGFFYPSKKRKLTPYLSLVEDNWKRAMSLGEEIFWIATVTDSRTDSWASICNWRSTFSGWVSQHLIASGNSAYPLMLMLGTQLKVIREAESKPYHSFQNWYRPTNKYARKVFGILGDSIRTGASLTNDFRYFTVDLRKIPQHQMNVSVVKCGNKKSKELVEYLTTQRGEIYIESEELNVDDVELAALNDLYMKAGLQRKRSFWLAYHPSCNGPAAAIISYKAPVGLNFSMLENRSELIVTDHLSEPVKIEASCALLKEASSFYSDFPAPIIPLVTEERNVGVLSRVGIIPIRSYNQFIWTKLGYQDWYDSLYAIAANSINRWRKYDR